MTDPERADPWASVTAFHLFTDAYDLKATVTHETATGRLISIALIDRRSGEVISIPPYAFDALVEAINAKKEY